MLWEKVRVWVFFVEYGSLVIISRYRYWIEGELTYDNLGQGASDKPSPTKTTKSLSEQFEEEVKDFVPVDKQFPDGNFPVGEISEYKRKADDRTAIDRMTNEEKKVIHGYF